MTVCGVILKNDPTCHVWSFWAYPGERNFEMAELLAAIITIEKAKEFNWKKFLLETDCLLVVKAFSSTNIVPWKIKSHWLSCQTYTISIDFMMSHIYRKPTFMLIFWLTLVFPLGVLTGSILFILILLMVTSYTRMVPLNLGFALKGS